MTLPLFICREYLRFLRPEDVGCRAACKQFARDFFKVHPVSRRAVLHACQNGSQNTAIALLSLPGAPRDSRVTAASAGKPRLVQAALDIDCGYDDPFVPIEAAKKRDWRLLQLYSTRFPNRIGGDYRPTTVAADVDTLRFMKELGYVIGEQTLLRACDRADVARAEYLLKARRYSPIQKGHAAAAAAASGCLPLVKRLTRGSSRPMRVVTEAASYGDLPMLQYLLDEGNYTPSDKALFHAAARDDRDAIRLLWNAGARNTAEIVLGAICGGHLRLYREYVVGIHLRSSFADSAIRRGNLRILEDLYWRDAPLCSLMTHAALFGHIHLLRWGLTKGYRINAWTIRAAVSMNRLDVVEWFMCPECPYRRPLSTFMDESNSVEMSRLLMSTRTAPLRSFGCLNGFGKLPLEEFLALNIHPDANYLLLVPVLSRFLENPEVLEVLLQRGARVRATDVWSCVSSGNMTSLRLLCQYRGALTHIYSFQYMHFGYYQNIMSMRESDEKSKLREAQTECIAYAQQFFQTM